MKRRLVVAAFVLAGIVVALVLLRWGLRPAPAPTSPQEEGGAIFFVRQDIVMRQEYICRYDLATGKLHVITWEAMPFLKLSASYYSPCPDGTNRFSACPDGTKVAFVRRRGRKDHVYVVDAVPGVSRDLTRHLVDGQGARIWHVAWSPDGKAIAFSHRAGKDCRVYVTRPDGSDLREVAKWPPIPKKDLPEAFADAEDVEVSVVGLGWRGSRSPKLLVEVGFSIPVSDTGVPTHRKGDELLYLVKLDARDFSVHSLRPTTEPEEPDLYGWAGRRVWSPDRKYFAYAAMHNLLFTVNADGVRMKTRVYRGDETTEIGDICWSPSGSYLVFEHLTRRPIPGVWPHRSLLSALAGPIASRGLVVVSAKGGEPFPITQGGLFADRCPRWIACPPLPDAP